MDERVQSLVATAGGSQWEMWRKAGFNLSKNTVAEEGWAIPEGYDQINAAWKVDPNEFKAKFIITNEITVDGLSKCESINALILGSAAINAAQGLQGKSSKVKYGQKLPLDQIMEPAQKERVARLRNAAMNISVSQASAVAYLGIFNRVSTGSLTAAKSKVPNLPDELLRLLRLICNDPKLSDDTLKANATAITHAFQWATQPIDIELWQLRSSTLMPMIDPSFLPYKLKV